MIHPRLPRRRKTLLLGLVLLMPGLSGCGLGWLYMRMADSQRIKGQKILVADNNKLRFRNAQTFYKKALKNYEESLLYDEDGNPSVYYKFGYTYLLLDPPDIGSAMGMFSQGLKRYSARWTYYRIKQGEKKDRPQADISTDSQRVHEELQKISRYLDEEDFLDSVIALEEAKDEERSEDFALTLAGLGMCHFLNGMRDRASPYENEDKVFPLAIKYFEAAERWTRHPKLESPTGLFDRIRDSMDLFEVVHPTPTAVLLARVHLYLGRILDRLGHGELAANRLQNAQDALERIRIYYEKEPRYLSEMAQLYYQRYRLTKQPEHMEKCAEFIGQVGSSQGYWDARVTNLLRARVLLELKKKEEVQSVLLDLLERDPHDPWSQLLQARYQALVGDYPKVKDSVSNAFIQDDAKRDIGLLLETGHVYTDMNDHEQAKEQYLQASYADSKNIAVNYFLGQAYRALGDSKNMNICFRRVVNFDASSSYAKEVLPLITDQP